jgi:hypothetical protein
VRADSAELESNFDATVNDLTLCRRDLNVCRSAEQHAAAQCDTTRNQRGMLPTTEGSRNTDNAPHATYRTVLLFVASCIVNGLCCTRHGATHFAVSPTVGACGAT